MPARINSNYLYNICVRGVAIDECCRLYNGLVIWDILAHLIIFFWGGVRFCKKFLHVVGFIIPMFPPGLVVRIPAHVQLKSIKLAQVKS